MNTSLLAQTTTLDFFARMNQQGVEYALLRNYETYPDFSHDVDLVVRWSDLSRWRAITQACAADHGWDVLTECDHWARSSSREHTIQARRFYTIDRPQYLHIDAFHSFVVLGLPLVAEDVLLRDRVWDERGFYRINECVENFYRLMQIARLAPKGQSTERVERYRQRVLTFLKTASNFSDVAASLEFPEISKALVFLESGDIRSFKKEIDRQKRRWLIGTASSRPFSAGKMIFHRMQDYLRLFWLRPCGFEIPVFAPDATHRERLERIMSYLVDTNLIPLFSSSTVSRERRRIKERGGIVLEMGPRERAQVVVDPSADDPQIIAALTTLIVERHPRVWSRSESKPHEND